MKDLEDLVKELRRIKNIPLLEQRMIEGLAYKAVEKYAFQNMFTCAQVIDELEKYIENENNDQ